MGHLRRGRQRGWHKVSVDKGPWDDYRLKDRHRLIASFLLMLRNQALLPHCPISYAEHFTRE